MERADVYTLTRRAHQLALSFSQMGALDWMARQTAPVFTRDYRRADVRWPTLKCLETRGFVDHGSDACGIYWFVTEAGRTAAALGVE